MTSSIYGPRLAKWIQDHLPDGASWRSFAPAHNIEPTRLFAWRRGATPSLEQIALVAEAFGCTRTEILVVAGYLPPGDGAMNAEVDLWNVEVAIERDPSLDQFGREMLRQVLKTLVSRPGPSVKIL
jgi:hypothetical protein